MGYTAPPQKYWNYAKMNAAEGHEVWTLAGKAKKFLAVIQSYHYNTEY